jgi:hypothetical protein
MVVRSIVLVAAHDNFKLLPSCSLCLCFWQSQEEEEAVCYDDERGAVAREESDRSEHPGPVLTCFTTTSGVRSRCGTDPTTTDISPVHGVNILRVSTMRHRQIPGVVSPNKSHASD